MAYHRSYRVEEMKKLLLLATALIIATSPAIGFEPKSKPKEYPLQHGTGFFVTYKHVLTASHIFDKCGEHIQLANHDIMWGAGGAVAVGKVVARDSVNDLALITSNVQSNQFAELRLNPAILGESVWVYGFPLQITLTAPNFTNGIISATSGMNNNLKKLQITAPIQLGNSGSPLLDKFGTVVGVVIGKFNAGPFNEQYADIPQNINFAVKANVAMSFMSTSGLKPTVSSKSTLIDPTEIAKTAQEFTIKIRCEVKE